MYPENLAAGNFSVASTESWFDLIASDETFDEKVTWGSIASDETFDESVPLPIPGTRDAAGSEPAGIVDGQLRDAMLYMGGPVNYDRYIDPAVCRQLVELGLLTEHDHGAIELTLLGADVYRRLSGTPR
jgi:hypothetical protein